MKQKMLRLAVLTTATISAQPLLAQNDRIGLEEIIVTAQRRAQNLQDVPIAVSAVTGSMIEKVGIIDTQSLQQVVPGLQLSRQGGAALPFIRGVGTLSGTQGNEPSIAQFIDDVYNGSANANIFEFNSIESIEVLKGPQGTLFGRNATGGVIHVHTKDPSHDPEMDINVGYGNYDTLTTQFYASSGLTDNMAANIAAFVTDQGDGWGDDPFGNDIYANEAWGVRAKLLIEPDDSTSILFSANYNQRESDQGIALSLVPGLTGRFGNTKEALAPGFWDGMSGADNYYDSTHLGLSAKVTKELEHFDFVSITAYHENDMDFTYDLGVTPEPFFLADSINPSEQITQEFQLLSPDDSDVSWLMGMFYLYNDSTYEAVRYYGPVFGPYERNAKATQITNSYSAFAEISTEIMPRTNLTLGIRYTHDARELEDNLTRTYVAATGDNIAVIGPLSDEETFKNMTGRLALDYRFTEDSMGYIAYNRGFKSGVYNLASSDTTPVEPEEIDAFTLGFKTEFPDAAVRLNSELFYYEYTNIQVQNNLPTGGGTRIVNGGEATIQGIEVELNWQPTDNLNITAAAVALDSEYDEFDLGPKFFPQPPNDPIPIPAGCAFDTYPSSTGPLAQVGCDLAGNELVQANPLTTTLSFIYTIPSDIGTFDISANWSHRDEVYGEPDNSPSTEIAAVDLINASIKWTSASETFDVRIWGNNLTEEEYYAYVAHSATSGTKYSPQSPRTYGITFGYHWQ
jgi:iron complex outermembrane recepter protein